MGQHQTTVVGGGLVGAAIAYGIAREGMHVRVLDQGDVAFRASRGNFGLVWVQSKGRKLPRYARWSRDAAQLWPTLQKELMALTGVDVGLRQPGGFWLAFSDDEMTARYEMLDALNRKAGGIPFQMMDPSELREYLPGVGPSVVGGSFCPLDGHANPLMLLRALYAGLRQMGAELMTGVDVKQIKHVADSGLFEVTANDGQQWKSERLVLAAGLGNARLATQVGLHAPVMPSRGQILITERLKPFLAYPTNKARQTCEGTVQIGSTSEDVGLDDGTTPDKIEWLANRAVATFPALSRARLVRAWGALRPMTPDGFPIYEESEVCPGAFVVACHSGVTLAATHAYLIGPWLCGTGESPPDMEAFKGNRFLNMSQSGTYEH